MGAPTVPGRPRCRWRRQMPRPPRKRDPGRMRRLWRLVAGPGGSGATSTALGGARAGVRREGCRARALPCCARNLGNDNVLCKGRIGCVLEVPLVSGELERERGNSQTLRYDFVVHPPMPAMPRGHLRLLLSVTHTHTHVRHDRESSIRVCTEIFREDARGNKPEQTRTDPPSFTRSSTRR